jgi:hypothetical protein
MTNNPDHSHTFNPNAIDVKLAEILLLQRLDKEDRDRWRAEFNAKIDGVDERLKRVEQQCLLTNGKIIKHTGQIDALEKINELEEARQEEIESIISTKKFINKWLINKWFIVFLIVLGAGILKVISSPWLQGILRPLSGI